MRFRVCILVFNAELWIEECINSVFNDYEIFIMVMIH